MIDLFKTLISNQFNATFCALGQCVDACPEQLWDSKISKFKFCHVAFHTLIFADLYLSRDETSFREQAFHGDNLAFFNDYDELSYDSTETTPERAAIERYLNFCRAKASEVVSGESADSLHAKSGFDWLEFSRAEVHVYNIRHIQHHAAQLSLHLRRNVQQDFSWVKSGWVDN